MYFILFYFIFYLTPSLYLYPPPPPPPRPFSFSSSSSPNNENKTQIQIYDHFKSFSPRNPRQLTKEEFIRRRERASRAPHLSDQLKRAFSSGSGSMGGAGGSGVVDPQHSSEERRFRAFLNRVGLGPKSVSESVCKTGYLRGGEARQRLFEEIPQRSDGDYGERSSSSSSSSESSDEEEASRLAAEASLREKQTRLAAVRYDLNALKVSDDCLSEQSEQASERVSE